MFFWINVLIFLAMAYPGYGDCPMLKNLDICVFENLNDDILINCLL
jgi:hypothetical protein